MRNRIPSLLGAAVLAAGALSAVLPMAAASAADRAAAWNASAMYIGGNVASY